MDYIEEGLISDVVAKSRMRNQRKNYLKQKEKDDFLNNLDAKNAEKKQLKIYDDYYNRHEKVMDKLADLQLDQLQKGYDSERQKRIDQMSNYMKRKDEKLHNDEYEIGRNTKKKINNRNKRTARIFNAADERIKDDKNRNDLDTAKLVLKTKLGKLNNSKIGSKINDFGKNKLHFNGKSIGRKLKIKLREDVELYRYYNEMM